jgi:hypothetical protein
MATTGAELGRELDLLVDKPYTAFFDNAKKNRLLTMAFVNLREKKYNNLDRQQVYDELTHFLKTGVQKPIRDGRIYTKPIQVVGLVFSPTDITYTTAVPHGLVVGDNVTVTDVQGVALANVANSPVLTVVSETEFTIGVVGASGTYVALTGVMKYSNMLPDYHHLLSVECEYEEVLRYKDVKVECAEGTPIVVRFNRPVDFRTGEVIRISGVTGNTAANGDYYVRKVGLDRYELYQDADFLVPVASNFPYNSGGIVRRVVKEYAMPYVSDQKISTFGEATKRYPKFEIAQGFLKFEPRPSSIVIDYMTSGVDVPTVRIDVVDTVTDLELYYPKKFLMRLVNEAADLFHLSVRDLSQYQAQTQETIENP